MKKPWVKRRRRRLNYTKRPREKLVRYNKDLKFYPSPVYEVERNGKTFLRRTYRARHRGSLSTVYLRICNRRVRYFKGEVPKGNGYRKLADYWWLLY